MKKKIKVIILCLIVGVGAYFGTLLIDNIRKGGEVKPIVTFDDTTSYVIPSIKKMNKEEALKEWPYIINVSNAGSGKGLYQVKIMDVDTSTIKRDKLEYVLFLDDKEIKTGKLKDINDNILYTGEILGNTKQEFKLYIWVTSDVDEKDTYEYKLEFIVIKSGGPGF